MEHKKKLEDLNKESLKRYDEYLKSKTSVKEEDQARIDEAKEEWQLAWTRFMEALMVLERLEL